MSLIVQSEKKVQSLPFVLVVTLSLSVVMLFIWNSIKFMSFCLYSICFFPTSLLIDWYFEYIKYKHGLEIQKDRNVLGLYLKAFHLAFKNFVKIITKWFLVYLSHMCLWCCFLFLKEISKYIYFFLIFPSFLQKS